MNIEFAADTFELTAELEKYAHAKIAQLARKVPRKSRSSAVCIVAFSQLRKKGIELNTCSITFSLKNIQLKAEETTLHMYSSLDVAAVHIGNQLKDYAAKHGRRPIRGILRAAVRHSIR